MTSSRRHRLRDVERSLIDICLVNVNRSHLHANTNVWCLSRMCGLGLRKVLKKAECTKECTKDFQGITKHMTAAVLQVTCQMKTVRCGFFSL